MKIVNKTQFANFPNGTLYCLFTPSIFDEMIRVKTGFYEDLDHRPNMNGVVPLCPYFEYDINYNGVPSINMNYYSQSYSTDVTLADYDDDQLFAIFSRAEIGRMINILVYAISGGDSTMFVDDDDKESTIK